MQQLNALKTLKDPPHGWACGRLADLIGNGLLGLGQPCPQAVDEQAENHDETEGHDALGFLDKDGGGQKERIFEKAKAALSPALPFVGGNQLLVSKNGWLQDIGANDPACPPKGFLRDPFLVNAHGCHNLPLVADGRSVFAWPTLGRILSMSDQVSVDIEPSRLLFQFPLGSGAGISFAGKALIREMPAFLFPARLRFAHLSLHGLLSTLE